jgi:hypothetical protein
MIYFIAGLNEQDNTYSIIEVTDNWHKTVSGWHPYDVIDGKLLIMDESGHKYHVGPHKNLAETKHSVEVGEWNLKNDEPHLIDTHEKDPEELRTFIASFLSSLARKKRMFSRKPAFPELDEAASYPSLDLKNLLALAVKIKST